MSVHPSSTSALGPREMPSCRPSQVCTLSQGPRRPAPETMQPEAGEGASPGVAQAVTSLCCSSFASLHGEPLGRVVGALPLFLHDPAWYRMRLRADAPGGFCSSPLEKACSAHGVALMELSQQSHSLARH